MSKVSMKYYYQFLPKYGCIVAMPILVHSASFVATDDVKGYLNLYYKYLKLRVINILELTLLSLWGEIAHGS